jgi:hypothetical protein
VTTASGTATSAGTFTVTGGGADRHRGNVSRSLRGSLTATGRARFAGFAECAARAKVVVMRMPAPTGQLVLEDHRDSGRVGEEELQQVRIAGAVLPV